MAAGTQGTDAVNLNQLNSAVGQAKTYTDQRFNEVGQALWSLDKSTRQGIAAASAVNLVAPYLPGRTTLNAGIAAYRGQAALGIGVSRWNDKGTVNLNAGISSAGGSSTLVRTGIGLVVGN